MRLINRKALEKLKKKKIGNRPLTKAIDKLINDIQACNWESQKELIITRPDADSIHEDGFYFFNINVHRTMILLEFGENEASVVWVGDHQKYEQIFQNNKDTIRKWLSANDLDIKIMKTQLDIQKLLENGIIENALDFERALITDRKLRVLSKEDPKYKVLRKKLRQLIEAYENRHWSAETKITNQKIQESDLAEIIAEQERLFIKTRKELIRQKLKDLSLSQQNLGLVLGHGSKSYMSELMNGLSPFSLRDLIIINRLLKIDLTDLIPTFLAQADRKKVRASIEKLDNPKLSFYKDDFAIA